MPTRKLYVKNIQNELLASRSDLMQTGAYLAPVTELTSSEDEQDQLPPGKKARRDDSLPSHASPRPFSAQELLNESCQCSKERSSGGSCYLKFKDSLTNLIHVREQFQSLHKIDQDQVAPKLLINTSLYLVPKCSIPKCSKHTLEDSDSICMHCCFEPPGPGIRAPEVCRFGCNWSLRSGASKAQACYQRDQCLQGCMEKMGIGTSSANIFCFGRGMGLSNIMVY